MSVIVAAASSGASTTDVFGAVFAGVGVLVVVLGGILGVIWRHIGSVKTDLTAALGDVKGDLLREVGRVEAAGERRFDKLDRGLADVGTTVQDVSVRLTVFEAREDERGRMEVLFRRAQGIVEVPSEPQRPAAG